MTRVLHVSRFFHPHVGGTENFIAALADAVAPYGIESSVLASARYADEPGPAPRVEVVRLDVVGPDPLPLPYRGLRTLASLVYRADIVHVHDLRFLLEPITLVARRSRTPLVVSTHGLIFHTPRLKRLKSLAWRSYYRALLDRAAVVACDSGRDLEYCRAIGLDNARLVQDAVAVKPFLRIERRPSGEHRLLSFGRIAPNKRLERLAPILDAAPEWRLTVVGRGDDRYVSQLRQRLGTDRATFLGAVSDEELAHQLATHDCFVLPSSEEGFGLSLVEAMASGIPVVASDIAPFREIADGTPVRLVDFDDVPAAKHAIAAALTDYAAAEARARAAEFAWERRAADFAALYAEVGAR